MNYFLAFLILIAQVSFAQTPIQRLNEALIKMQQDELYKDAAISFTLIDIKSGKVLFEKNKEMPLASASILKTFTTASAFHILGENFRYQTRVTFKGQINNKIGYGTLTVYGSGDPSLGSDRFDETKPEAVKRQISDALHKMGIQTLHGKIDIISNLFTDEAINRHWPEDDIANYYGAGIYSFNWKENKFEISLIPSGHSFEVSNNSSYYDNKKDFCVELIQKEGATTETAVAFFEKDKACQYSIRGELDEKEKIQTIQLASLHPDEDFKKELTVYLKQELNFIERDSFVTGSEKKVTTILSPPLSKLVYWCNQKSLNLYAEAFCKTMDAKLHKKGSWPGGIAAMMNVATQRHISIKNVSLNDASGLSPDNSITTQMLANMLRLNTKEKWYNSFYESLPLINELHMKSGYIGGTRSYAGHLTLKDGRKTCFAFILHNYSSTPKEAKQKMFELLDILK